RPPTRRAAPHARTAARGSRRARRRGADLVHVVRAGARDRCVGKLPARRRARAAARRRRVLPPVPAGTGTAAAAGSTPVASARSAGTAADGRPPCPAGLHPRSALGRGGLERGGRPPVRLQRT